MCHEGPHYRARLSASLPCRRIVDCFEETEPPDKPLGRESLQIQAGILGRHHQRKHRGIWRDDQILGQSALESQARHAEGAVLVIEVPVDRVVAGFRHAPGNAALASILDLSGYCRLAGLVEQRVIVGRHHQEGHQVLEHRAAPRQEYRFPTGADEQSPQGEPALLRQFPLCNCHETAQSRFGGQQVVVAGVRPALAHVVTDAQQMTRLVEQEVILHAREFTRLQCQAFDGLHPCPGTGAAFRDMLPQFGDPTALRGRRLRVKPKPDARTQLGVEPRQSAQGRDCRNVGELRQIGIHANRCRRQQ